MWRSSLDGILKGAELKSSALLLPLAPCWAGAHPDFVQYVEFLAIFHAIFVHFAYCIFPVM